MAANTKRSAKKGPEPAKFRVGDIYVGVNPPKHEWRVERAGDDSIELVRVDKPTAFRFVSSAVLRDPLRYIPKSTKSEKTRGGTNR